MRKGIGDYFDLIKLFVNFFSIKMAIVFELLILTVLPMYFPINRVLLSDNQIESPLIYASI